MGAVQERGFRVTRETDGARVETEPSPLGGEQARLGPLLSVVIPTKDEAGNVGPLIRRLGRALEQVSTQIVFVDDSSDETVDAIGVARADCRCDVEVIHRMPAERRGGLGSAVLAGMRIADAPWICVIDADLQHPPELIPRLLARADRFAADVVVASRYGGDGSIGEFGHVRSALSRATTTAAHVAFPRRLRAVSDPMSGFFVVRRDAIELERLRPHGFKILVEIVARHSGLRICEVPFEFGSRHAGRSKASLREGLIYGVQLCRLRVSATAEGFSRLPERTGSAVGNRRHWRRGAPRVKAAGGE